MCEIYDNNKNTTYSTANNSSRLRKVKVGAKYTWSVGVGVTQRSYREMKPQR